MNVVPPKFGMGASALRLEDDAFVTGRGNYADDHQVEGALHGYVLRSPFAKARIVSIDADEARQADGVHLVLTADDIGHLGKLKCNVVQPEPDGSRRPSRDIPVLCGEIAQYVGDAVAFVVADSRALAQDAAELIEVDYDDEEPAIGTAEALADGAPLVWPELETNRAFVNQWGDKAATDAAFEKAAHIARVEFVNNRLVTNYMEPRAATGEWRPDENRFVLNTGSQGVHGIRNGLAGPVFGISNDQLRVVTGDVGGGFGTKAFLYREHALVLEAAKRLGRPVKWTSDRTEHFMTDSQGRDNVTTAEMAMDEDGKFLAVRTHVIANMGGYTHQFGPMIPMFGSFMATGVYHIPAMDYVVTGVYTNTCPVDAYRGAGRPEAAFMIETLVEACAKKIGVAPSEIRRRNFIQPAQLPYHTPGGRMYDVGEFEANMDQAIERADMAGFEARLAQSTAAGKMRGIGMATYVEACAFAGSEPAFLELNPDGMLTLKIGTQSNGQGHATAYAQFVADKLNIDIARIQVRQGDTDELASGGGTGGSRSVPLGGVSCARAGEALAVKLKKIAADELEAAPDDIELIDGQAVITGTDRRIDFADIARAAKSPDDLKAEGDYVQDEATYPTGTHICEVEIDPDTGVTEILRYTIVDDFGATVNPLLLEGQVHGGVVQGLGQALFENTVYSEDGQLISASFMDYTMPRADNVPFFHFETRNVPSTTNALGIKGAGEAGTIGATPAVMNAVTDALWRGCGISHIDMPATPNKVWQAIADARAS